MTFSDATVRGGGGWTDGLARARVFLGRGSNDDVADLCEEAARSSIEDIITTGVDVGIDDNGSCRFLLLRLLLRRRGG